jgi:hypothetical protein
MLKRLPIICAAALKISLKTMGYIFRCDQSSISTKSADNATNRP